MVRRQSDPIDESLSGDELYRLAFATKYEDQKIRLLNFAAEKGFASANWALFMIEDLKLKPGDDGRTAFAHAKSAADNGNVEASLMVGDIYRVGLYPYCRQPFPKKAIKYYDLTRMNSLKNMKKEISPEAKIFFCCSCNRLADMYLKGEGVVISEDIAYELTKSAAYYGLFCNKLAEYYANGIGIEANDEEAYIWTLIHKAGEIEKYTEQMIKQLFEHIKAPINTSRRIALQKEASRRVNIMSVRPLTDEDVAVFTPTSTHMTEVQSTEPVANKAPEHTTNSNIEMDNEVDIDCIETSTNPVFKYINQVKKSFDPNKIKIKLVADVVKKEEDASDFKYFVFSYGSLHDRKSIDVFATPKFKIHPRERQLLIRLAIQYSNKDSDLSKQNIATILRRPDLDKTIISCLNKLMLHVFPECFKTTQSNLIDRKAGKLKIPIYFPDIWRIELCKDFADLKRV